ncbi:chromosome transmission fidelity protein 18 [Coniella lustricola]|uniref:Chromosome transmission fidelity protein 18 n=1 Tax=Coniella lustricola TaxID=2025994 RepID=A0A2T3AJN7_9PEZI|nr:chromosome transmission fidelity protein 18 [Coniella lustricola]
MAAPSSPIAYPHSSSPVAPKKRPAPVYDASKQTARPKARGGFLVEDSSDEEDIEFSQGHASKKIMLDDPRTAPSLEALEADQATIDQTQDERTQEQTLPGISQIQIDTQLNSIAADEEARYARLFNGGYQSIPRNPYGHLRLGRDGYAFVTCTGKSDGILKRSPTVSTTYQDMVANRSKTKEGRAKRAYFGVDIHQLVAAANQEIEAAKPSKAATAASAVTRVLPSVEERSVRPKKSKKSMLWTEKYRARKFMDLVGDDHTNRQVLRWLKRWDPIVFPHSSKTGSSKRQQQQQQQQEEEKPHRKVLMLTGPPGLGKTTLAHVCARQAGYEVLEINASDDRSREVVRGRIRNSLGTENVKTVEHTKPTAGVQNKVARPVCVVVDEVDGVTTGAGPSGEGGFVKALIDLVLADQKNSSTTSTSGSQKKRKGDDFRQMRPLILICNDVYHPSLRPLRQSGLADVVRIGKPSVETVVNRLRTVFEKEGIPCEKDAARKLCEAAWGMTTGIDAKRGSESTAEGDLRGVMVLGEWVAGRLKATSTEVTPQLTRQWVDKHVAHDLQHGGGGARGLGRGGTKDIVSRVFQEGAGFPRQADTGFDKKTRHEQPQAQLGFSEHLKKVAMELLREMVDTSGEVDRIMTEIFSEYPNREFNDDLYLSKPNEAYEWLNFHDICSSRLYASQEWELAPYLSQPVLACHHLFASPHRQPVNNSYDKQWRTAEGDEGDAVPLPFTGPRADYAAFEAVKQNRSLLQGLQGQLPPTLSRVFRSPEDIATEFVPFLMRLVSPDVKPVVVGGSTDKGSVASVRRDVEKDMVRRAAEVLAEVGISMLKGKIEDANPSMAGRTQWVYRMDPDLDMLSTFETAGAHGLATQVPVRYAVRQVLDQELHKTIALREAAARQARFKAGRGAADEDDMMIDTATLLSDNKQSATTAAKWTLPIVPTVKKDFFGRVIMDTAILPLHQIDGNSSGKNKGGAAGEDVEERKVWVTYHEGLNNAVRKPLTLEDFLRGF